MSEHAAVSKLKEKFSASIIEVTEFRGETAVTVKKEDIVAICEFLKKEQGYDFLTDLCAIDNLGQSPRFMMVYQLYSIKSKDRLRIKAAVDEGDCRVDTVSVVWGTANWLERECWDMMGIVFNNHPDHRRILMPEEFDGHPLRKDYPVQGTDREPYQGRVS